MDRGKQDPARKPRHLSLVGREPETSGETPPSRRDTQQAIIVLLIAVVLLVLNAFLILWLV